MGDEKLSYDKEFFQKLLYSENWPSIANPEFLNELNNVADKAFKKGTVEGYMASLLIYHQITEEMIKALLEFSHFFIQCNIYPTEMNFKLEEKKMYGYYLNKLEETIIFPRKNEFIMKCKKLNSVRIDIVHEITKKKSIDEIKGKMEESKKIFDEIYQHYVESNDWFMLSFKDFRKDIDWEDYINDYEDEIELIENTLKENNDKRLEKRLIELKDIVKILETYM